MQVLGNRDHNRKVLPFSYVHIRHISVKAMAVTIVVLFIVKALTALHSGFMGHAHQRKDPVL